MRITHTKRPIPGRCTRSLNKEQGDCVRPHCSLPEWANAPACVPTACRGVPGAMPASRRGSTVARVIAEGLRHLTVVETAWPTSCHGRGPGPEFRPALSSRLPSVTSVHPFPPGLSPGFTLSHPISSFPHGSPTGCCTKEHLIMALRGACQCLNSNRHLCRQL